jgi:hypothetical protein
MNPQAPTQAQIKLHKNNQPIRPVVNYRKAPTYKLSKFLDKELKEHINLNYTYSLTNSLQCAQSVDEVNIDMIRRLMSLDISNLYTNIPIEEVVEIIERKLQEESRLSSAAQDELITLIKLTTTRNYFGTDGKY